MMDTNSFVYSLSGELRGSKCIVHQHDVCSASHYSKRTTQHRKALYMSKLLTVMPTSRATATPRIGRFLQQASDRWAKTQLTHFGGKYSIERMLAFGEYSHKTSLARVILVIIGIPLLLAGIVLCQEIVPLQVPSDGWKVNYGFWVRVGILGIAIAYCLASQIGVWFDSHPLSLKQVVVYCTTMCIGHIATGLLVSGVSVFPVPFFALSLSVLWSPMTLGLLRAVTGAKHFRELSLQRESLRSINKASNLQGFMAIAYPAYQVLFDKVNNSPFELPVVLLLPAFKLLMKFLYACAIEHREDMIPMHVIFTVDVFDAIYLATFMQHLSPTSLLVIMSVDLTQTAIELHELHRRTQDILARIYTATAVGVGALNRKNHDNLLSAVRLLCFNPEQLKQQNCSNVRIHSCVSHKLSPEVKCFLEKIQKAVPRAGRFPHSAKKVIVSTSGSSKYWSRKITPVHPQPSSAIAHIRSESSELRHHDGIYFERIMRRQLTTKDSEVLQDALEVLFTSECLVLSEYLEVIIPGLYGAFILVMVHLPSAQYHSEMKGVTTENVENMVSGIFLYTLLELASFVVLMVITRRNCGIHALYQLSFVLESQWSIVMSMSLLWILITLTYRIEHYGADFSFQFDWI